MAVFNHLSLGFLGSCSKFISLASPGQSLLYISSFSSIYPQNEKKSTSRLDFSLCTSTTVAGGWFGVAIHSTDPDPAEPSSHSRNTSTCVQFYSLYFLLLNFIGRLGGPVQYIRITGVPPRSRCIRGACAFFSFCSCCCSLSFLGVGGGARYPHLRLVFSASRLTSVYTYILTSGLSLMKHVCRLLTRSIQERIDMV